MGGISHALSTGGGKLVIDHGEQGLTVGHAERRLVIDHGEQGLTVGHAERRLAIDPATMEVGDRPWDNGGWRSAREQIGPPACHDACRPAAAPHQRHRANGPSSATVENTCPVACHAVHAQQLVSSAADRLNGRWKTRQKLAPMQAVHPCSQLPSLQLCIIYLAPRHGLK